jgi:SAM-dependent methyltransferase
MKLDSSTKIQIFETALFQYAVKHYVNRFPTRLENSMLGVFIVFLSMNSSPLDSSLETGDMGDLIRSCIQDFQRYFHNHYKADIEFFARDISIQDQSLHDFIWKCKSLELSLLELKEMLDRIISNSPRHSGLGIFRTPVDIIELMIKLVDVNEGDKILDPASGSGGFSQTLKLSSDKSFSFTGIEINSTSHAIACLYSFLLSDMTSHLILENSFKYANKLEGKFDIVMCNPPVGKIPDQVESRYQQNFNPHRFSSESALNFIEISLNSLKPDGRAVFLINISPLFASQGEIVSIRRYWIESGYLKKVISLPSKLLPSTSLKCAILVFEKGCPDTGIKFVKAEDCYQDLAKGARRIVPLHRF